MGVIVYFSLIIIIIMSESSSHSKLLITCMNTFNTSCSIIDCIANSNWYVLALSERFPPADKSFWHSSLFLYFWTCTIMLLVADQKVELHLFSYVGAVLEESPRHLSALQRGVHRALQRGWPCEEGGRVDAATEIEEGRGGEVSGGG